MDHEPKLIDGKYAVKGPCSNAGGMGTLLYVTTTVTSTPMVLKLCKLSDPEMLARFRREVRVMQEFSGNSYTVPILDANLDHDPPYFVMPKYELGDLMSQAANFRSNLAHVETVLSRMIACVSQLHDKGVFHRDIKPQNFLVGNGTMVVSDFGLCTEHESMTGFTRSSQWAGTIGYMPPEFMNGGFKGADATADIFMLGKSFYALLTGREPMYLVADGVPAQLFPIIERCCALSPQSRYQSLSSLKQSLKSAFDVLLGRAIGPGKAQALMRSIADRLRLSQQYNPTEVGEFVEALGMLDPADQHQVCMELPSDAFSLLSLSLTQQHLPQFIQIYRGMAENATYPWSFAETIANNMKILFDAESTSPADKAESLRVAIIAAVRQNRFAAMGTCRAMIVRTDEGELAQRVHDILIEHDTSFIQQIEPSECKASAVRAAIVALKSAADAKLAASSDDDFPF